MTLSVLGNEPLDTLEALVRDLYEAVPDHPVSLPPVPSQLDAVFGKEWFGCGLAAHAHGAPLPLHSSSGLASAGIGASTRP